MRNNVLYKFVLGTRGQKQRLIVKISEKLIFTHFSKEKNNRFFPSQPLGTVWANIGQYCRVSKIEVPVENYTDGLF